MTRHSFESRTRLMTRILLVALLPAAMAWAGPEEDQLKSTGTEALKPFKQQLMSALVKGLKEGPVSALEVCRDLAPKIAAEAGSDSVTIGRTSHRLRNQANAPEPWMEPLLEKYAGDPKMTAPTLVALSAGGHGYVEPITVRSACLKCHGDTLDPAVEKKIAELYPDDTARGFKEGDFRGLFWVIIAPVE